MARDGARWAWLAAAIPAVAGLIGGAVQGQATGKAADTMAQAAQIAANTSQAQYDQTRQDMLPFLATGQSAIGPLSQLLGLNPAQTAAGQSAAGLQSAQAMDWTAYLNRNPDVLNAYYKTQGIGNPQEKSVVPGLFKTSVSHMAGDALWGVKGGAKVDPAWAGKTAEDFAKYHYDTFGKTQGWSWDPNSGKWWHKNEGGPPAPTAAPANGAPMPQMAPGTGTAGGSTLDQLMNQAYAQPAFDAGIKAVQQSAYGSGKTGGGVLSDLMGYGMRFGSDLRQNEVNNLLAVLTGGQSSATSLGSLGNQSTAMINNANTQGANARASGYANNGWANGLGYLSGFFGSGAGQDALSSWFGRNRGGTSAPYGQVVLP
jgi:hypothetical protein